MKQLFYMIGKFFIKLSKKEFKIEEDLFQLAKMILDSTRDEELNKEEINSVRKKSYDIFIDYGFLKRK
jgi:hypothetical protein